MASNLIIEPPSVSKFGCQRNMGSFGVNKADFAWPPLDLMMISGYLEHCGLPVSIYDFNNTRMTFEDVRRTIIEEKPKIVVFSTSHTTIYDDLKIADIAKSVSKDILTVAIGTHIMALPEETLNSAPNLDVAIYNEPEEVVLNLVKENYRPSTVKGIYYREGEQIKKNPPQPNIQNLETLGFPSHDKIPIQIYHDSVVKRRPLALVMAHRGCPGECIFCCSSFWSEYRTRTVPHVIEELKWVKQLGYKEVFWGDTRLTSDLKWAHELMDKMIENKINLPWLTADHATSGIGQDQELLKKMKRAGCHQIRMGLESSNLQILKNAKKWITPDKVAKTAAMIKKAGIEVMIFTIFGLPGETKETIAETIKFVKSMDVDYATMGIAQPRPGTLFFDYLVKNNYLKTRDWNKYDPMLPPVYDYPNLSSQEIFEAHLQGLRSFYLRPSYIAKRILKIRSVSDFRNNLDSLLGFASRYILPNKNN